MNRPGSLSGYHALPAIAGVTETIQPDCLHELKRSMDHSRTKIFFVHQNFPGQLRRIVAQLTIEAEYEVLAIGKHGCALLPGLRLLRYKLHRVPAPGVDSFTEPFEEADLSDGCGGSSVRA